MKREVGAARMRSRGLGLARLDGGLAIATVADKVMGSGRRRPARPISRVTAAGTQRVPWFDVGSELAAAAFETGPKLLAQHQPCSEVCACGAFMIFRRCLRRWSLLVCGRRRCDLQEDLQRDDQSRSHIDPCVRFRTS